MSELRLVAVGKTGVGKSSFGNTVLNEKGLFRSSSQGSSVTNVCQFEETMTFGRYISMVDTPGFKDTRTDDKDVVMKEISRCIFLSAPGPHAICFVVQIGRFTQEDVDTVKEFVRHFGEALYKYAIIVFTRYDDYKRDCDDNDKECDIHNYILTLPSVLREFVVEKCGSRAIGFDNTLRGPNSQIQVEELFMMVDKTVNENGSEYYSNVDFKKAEKIIRLEMVRERRRLEQELEDKMENFRSQIEIASEEKIRIAVEKEKMALKAKIEEQMETRNLRTKVKQEELGFDMFVQFATTFVGLVVGGVMVYSKLRGFLK